MKNILILLALFFVSAEAFAVCSSVISRTNNSANTVLTSTKYNLDLNTIYTRINELPGDCITNGTITYEKLDTTSLAPLVRGVKEGCLATRSDANTISVDKCLIAISGTLIEKTTATTVTWGCSGCSSEVASTTYYVYATSASTLTLQILTTAPDAYGYNGTSRVLASFFNNASSSIDPLSVRNWIVTGLRPPAAIAPQVPAVTNPKACRYTFGGTGSLTSQTNCTGTCVEYYDNCDAVASAASRGGAGSYSMTFADGTWANNTHLWCTVSGRDSAGNAIEFGGGAPSVSTAAGGAAVSLYFENSAETAIDVIGSVSCEGQGL